MEEEYRMQKVQADIKSAGVETPGPNSTNGVIYEDGTVEYGERSQPKTNGNGNGNVGADDDASTRALASMERTGTPDGEKPATPNVPEDDETSESIETKEEGDGATLAETSTLESTTSGLERPSQAATKEEADGESAGQDLPPQDYSFSNKRLCERWLDNLFMVLYEVSLGPSSIASLLDIDNSCCSRICGYGQSSAPKLPTLKLNMFLIARRVLSGRS